MSGGMRDHRSIGNRNQQTVNCDFLNVARTARVHNINVELINNKTLKQLVAENNSDEIRYLKDEISCLKKAVFELQKNTGPVGFEAGKSVTVRINFEDVDVNAVDWNSVVFEQKLLSAMVDSSKITKDHIIIIEIKENGGGTIVELECRFSFSIDPLTQSVIEENLSDFILLLNSGIVHELDIFGDYKILSFSVGAIEGVNTKIAKIKNKFLKPEISFEGSQSLILGDYRLRIKEDQLFIQRFDHFLGDYVGGTIVTD